MGLGLRGQFRIGSGQKKFSIGGRLKMAWLL